MTYLALHCLPCSMELTTAREYPTLAVTWPTILHHVTSILWGPGRHQWSECVPVMCWLLHPWMAHPASLCSLPIPHSNEVFRMNLDQGRFLSPISTQMRCVCVCAGVSHCRCTMQCECVCTYPCVVVVIASMLQLIAYVDCVGFVSVLQCHQRVPVQPNTSVICSRLRQG